MPKKTTPDAADTIRAMHEVRENDLRSRLADLNERHKHTVALLKEADERLSAIVGLKDTVTAAPPKKFAVKAAGKPGEATAFLVASDWHLEERVDADTVNGLNEFTPAIAEKRVEKFFANGLALVDMARTRNRIDTLVLAVLGDLITNKLHEDQAESNYLSPTEASLKAYRLLCGGIDFLLANGGFKKILIPCNYGNHGRTTQRMRVSTAAKNSYEWMVYHLAAERYAGEPRVAFAISNGYFNFLEVYGTRFRLHHGDDVRYQGGVGGVHIPLNKAIAQWNKMQPVDVDVLGHWHTRLTARDYVVNGSLIGYTPYGIYIKASFERPCQSFFLVHPRYGKTLETPVYLE